MQYKNNTVYKNKNKKSPPHTHNLCCYDYIKSAHSTCVFLHPVDNSGTSILHHVHGLSVASFCMQVHLARDSVALTARVAQHSPQGQALCSRSRGANPPPCVPASFRMSSYGCHMWSRRKADAVFPFVKSSFWKDFSILMARTESVGASGWRLRRRAAQPLNANLPSSGSSL